MLIILIKNEMFKIFTNKKLYGFIIAISLFSLLPALESAMGAVNFPLSGQNLPLYMLASYVNLIMPIFIIVTLSDLITDEYVGGTLNLPLLHPVSRTNLLTSKLLALILPLTLLLIFGMMISYLVGTILFGWGDQVPFNDITLSTGAGIITTLGLYLTSVVPLLVFAALVMFICLQFSSSGAAVAISIGILMLLSVLGQIVVDLRPYLVITYFQELPNHLFFTGDWSKLVKDLMVLSVYGIGSYLASIYYFNKKDLLY